MTCAKFLLCKFYQGIANTCPLKTSIHIQFADFCSTHLNKALYYPILKNIDGVQDFFFLKIILNQRNNL